MIFFELKKNFKNKFTSKMNRKNNSIYFAFLLSIFHLVNCKTVSVSKASDLTKALKTVIKNIILFNTHILS